MNLLLALRHAALLHLANRHPTHFGPLPFEQGHTGTIGADRQTSRPLCWMNQGTLARQSVLLIGERDREQTQHMYQVNLQPLAREQESSRSRLLL